MSMSEWISDTPFDPKPARHGEPPQVVVAGQRIFAHRAERLRQLAARLPAMGEFLHFSALLCQAQHRTSLDRVSTVGFDARAWRVAVEHGVPPLTSAALLGSLDWRDDLDALLETLDAMLAREGERFAAQRLLLGRLIDVSAQRRLALARRLLDHAPIPRDTRALAPLVGGALQVAWTRLARTLEPLPGRPLAGAEGRCPCCGSAPLASVVQLGRQRSRTRYLHCGLCATEWYFERARCSQCTGTAKLDYIGCEDEQGKRGLALRAECCGECGGGLKLVDREWEADAEPLAEDLASLGLDALLDAEGYARAGFNPLLAFGD